MGWVRLLTLILGVAKALLGHLDRKKLMEAGAARQAANNINEAIHAIRKAQSARRAATYVPDELRDDVYNRDQ